MRRLDSFRFVALMSITEKRTVATRQTGHIAIIINGARHSTIMSANGLYKRFL